MKILGLVGSPRKKGNTEIMVDTFLEGAASAGAEVKKYFLADLDINQCQGCFRNCMLQPGLKCKRFRDDMDTLLPEMAASDLITVCVAALLRDLYRHHGALFRALPAAVGG